MLRVSKLAKSYLRLRSALIITGTRLYSTTTPPPALPALPPLTEWRKHFPITLYAANRERISLHNSEAAAQIVQALNIGAKRKNGQVIIEAYPGPGVLTRALLALPRSQIRKLIVLEDREDYLPFLKSLEGVDDRIVVVPKSGYDWTTYSDIEAQGLLSDVPVAQWRHECDLRFVSHLPLSVAGEQLISQLFRSAPSRSWLFRYGRVRMNIIMADWVYQRITAVNNQARCKLSVISQATVNPSLVVPAESLMPYEANFYPPPTHPDTVATKLTAAPSLRKAGHPFVAAEFVPKITQAVNPNNVEIWDFVTRQLFILKNSPLQKALPTIAPGAAALLKQIDANGVPGTKKVNALDVEDFRTIVQAFEHWPFAPKDLFIADIVNDRT